METSPVSPPPPDPAETQLQFQLTVVEKLLKSGKIAEARQVLNDAKQWDRQGRIDAFRQQQTMILQSAALTLLEQGKIALAAQIIKKLGQWAPQSQEYQALQARLTHPL